MTESGKNFAYAATYLKLLKCKIPVYLVLIEGRVCTDNVQGTQGKAERRDIYYFMVYEEVGNGYQCFSPYVSVPNELNKCINSETEVKGRQLFPAPVPFGNVLNIYMASVQQEI